jgi:hypothetical protein
VAEDVTTFHEEIENRLDELLETLRAPAVEFVPRARAILIAFMSAILRRLQALDDEEPTHPQAPSVARPRQHTMELDPRELIELTEQERRKLKR